MEKKKRDGMEEGDSQKQEKKEQDKELDNKS